MPLSFEVVEKVSSTLTGTVSLSEAAGRLWDVVVVGAGPAGSAAALELARHGQQVLLVDKACFPRTKVCGCCLNASAIRWLKNMGLDGLLDTRGAVPLKSLLLCSKPGTASVRLPNSFALSREAFDAALVSSAIESGVSFLPKTQGFLPAADGDLRTVRLAGLEIAETSARLVIAADGLGGRCVEPEELTIQPGSRIGASTIAGQAPEFYREGIVYMAVGNGGYVGLVRLEDGRLDIAAAFDPSAVRLAHAPWTVADEILQSAGLPQIPGLDELPWKGTEPLTRRRSKLAGHRLFVIGDAAGYAEPFTGEGIGWALHSAKLVAALALECLPQWNPEVAERWQCQHRKIIGRRQDVSLFLSKLLRHTQYSALATTILSGWPSISEPVVKYINAL